MSAGFSGYQRNTGGHRPPLQWTSLSALRYVENIGGAKEVVRRLQDNAPEANRVVILFIQKRANGVRGCAGVVAPKSGVHPVLGEKDIAGTLNLSKQIERWADVLLRLGAAQRVIQIAEAFNHPGFAAAVLHIGQIFEPRVSCFRTPR